ncbi:MAG TPA: CBS domain-containing protein [Candidatus Altiarchaeales archaeon]|nr:CBS domain-containing protein [Candidatus Altiarchaeales archaeon]HEX54522.1 CBS domain-containing protein [Candidatus Altiarchaeales archaeon]
MMKSGPRSVRILKNWVIKKISEMMVRDVVTARDDSDLMEIIELFGRYKYNAIPILDKNKNLVGIVTRSDLLKFITFERCPMMIDMESFIGIPDVRSFMCTHPLAMSPDDTIKDAASVMIRHGVRSVPIVKGRKLVGIISKHDIIQAIYRELIKS